MCYAPHRRALFRHAHFQKWSETVSFLHFWFGNALRATTACAFWTLRATTECKCSSLIWPASVLRTRRFSEPTFQIFQPSRATNHWKDIVNRDFPTLSCTCIFFLLTLSLPWSSYFFSSPLWLFPPLLFHLCILSEVWLLNFLRIIIVSNNINNNHHHQQQHQRYQHLQPHPHPSWLMTAIWQSHDDVELHRRNMFWIVSSPCCTGQDCRETGRCCSAKMCGVSGIGKIRETSWNIMKHHETSWNIMKHHETSWNIMKHHETSWNIMKHHETSWNIMKHHETSWNIMKHHETGNIL